MSAVGVICDTCYQISHGVRHGFECHKCSYIGNERQYINGDGKISTTMCGVTKEFFWVDMGGWHRLYRHPESLVLLVEKGCMEKPLGNNFNYCRQISVEYVEKHPGFLRGWPYVTSTIPKEQLAEMIQISKQEFLEKTGNKTLPKIWSEKWFADKVFEKNDLSELEWKQISTETLSKQLNII